MRDAQEHEVPRNAVKLAELARANGWILSITHAVQPDGQISIAVRMRREVAMYGVWVEGRFTGGACSSPLKPMKARDLLARVQEPEAFIKPGFYTPSELRKIEGAA